MANEVRPLLLPEEVIPSGSRVLPVQSHIPLVSLDIEQWESVRGSCGARQVLKIPRSTDFSLVFQAKYTYCSMLKTACCSRQWLPLPINGVFSSDINIEQHAIRRHMSLEEIDQLLTYATAEIKPGINHVKSI